MQFSLFAMQLQLSAVFALSTPAIMKRDATAVNALEKRGWDPLCSFGCIIWCPPIIYPECSLACIAMCIAIATGSDVLDGVTIQDGNIISNGTVTSADGTATDLFHISDGAVVANDGTNMAELGAQSQGPQH